MKKAALPTTLYTLIAAVAAYPAGAGLWPRGCEPGTLVCNGNTRFAICNMDRTAVWMSVSDGTVCVCSGSGCTIAATTAASTFTPTPTKTLASAMTGTLSTTQTQTRTQTQIQTQIQTQTQTRISDPKPLQKNPVNPVVVNPRPTSAAVVAASSPPPVAVSNIPASASSAKTYLRTFSGNGDASQGWPQESQWADFETMWSSNLANTIYKSCAVFGQINNSDQESAALKKAIQTESRSSGVDERFILAIVMQESGGCVRAPTTNYGVTNPGLMQSHNGAHSCYNVNPCPEAQLVGMIRDGTAGTPSGQGLQQMLAAVGRGAGAGASQYYKAARMYNSGSVAATGLLQDGAATHCYASDIANRLVGWSQGVGTCKFG